MTDLTSNVISEHVINCDTDPNVPKGCSVEIHRKGGAFKWNAEDVLLYLNEDQKNSWIGNDELRGELASKPVLNANVLDYLLDYTHLIPERWITKHVYFWGTIYRVQTYGSCVRFLGFSWVESKWGWDFGQIDGRPMLNSDPAAMSAR